MKKIYVFFFLALPIFFHAQITLNSSDLPQISDVVSTVNCDIPPSFSVGAAGSNQSYDFSSVIQVDTTSITYIIPSGTPGVSEYPSATLATEEDGDFIYYQETSDAFLILGVYIDTSQNNSGQYNAIKFNPSQKVFEIPSTFNTSYMDLSGFSVTIADDSGFADSIRATTTFDADALMDGYGTITTPNGAFDCLREFRIVTTTNTTELYNFGIWTTFATNTQVDTTYNWFADNSKGPIASASIENGVIVDVNYSTLSIVVSNPIANFSSADQGDGTVIFTDLSSNNPTTWLWDFGDGNTSTLQNPTHIYTVSGTYTVCLTVTNSAGSNTTCMNVNVSFIVAPVADFNFTYLPGGVVDFTDASINDPTSWLWDFGDGNTSTVQNPSHTYVAAGTYTACLTVTNSAGSNTICMSVSVVFAPVADFTSTVQQAGLVDFLDASTNAPTSWLWDFGDGNTSTDQDPSYTYTSTNMYTVCLTAMNDGGSDTKCETVNVVITSSENLLKKINVTLFPNPVSDILNIRLENQQREFLDFQITNVLGQSMLEMKVETMGDYFINVNTLSSGVYYFNFRDQNGVIRKSGVLKKRDQ